jgi:hypothetical protein
MRAMAEVRGASRGRTLWAALPARRARASGVRKARRARRLAGGRERRPKTAIWRGWEGNCKGENTSW